VVLAVWVPARKSQGNNHGGGFKTRAMGCATRAALKAKKNDQLPSTAKHAIRIAARTHEEAEQILTRCKSE
jgi:hypothetical protein